MAQPQWLPSSLHKSHLKHVIRILEARENEREAARAVRDSRSSGYRHAPSPPELKSHYSCSVGQHSSNKKKNRYLALEPYDRTRVLVPIPGDHDTREEEHRYLNANWVREAIGGKWWIAGQAPLPETIHAFLTLSMCPATPLSAHEPPSVIPPPRRRVQTIVQLTLLVEGGRQRAHPYFPNVLKDNMIVRPERGLQAPPIHIHVESEQRVDDAACVMTDLRLKWEKLDHAVYHDEWQVTHLLYTAWPDFGVPRENDTILKFAQLVERVNNRNLPEGTSPNDAPPVLVHCSAGVGRTGSFIALSSLLRAYGLLSSRPHTPRIAPPLPPSPLGPLPEDMKNDLIANEIDSLREQRQSMVQRSEQVMWVYEALTDALEDALRSK